MATTSSAMKDLSDQNSIGTRLGTTSTDLICFYGTTTASAKLAITGSISSGALASSMAAQLAVLGLISVTYAA